jgi:mRNA-degrading endonuclease toxin of MazEF toxin-antitoxin module
MPRECVLNLDHVETVAKGFVGDRLTTLRAEKLHAVSRALGVATGCG